MTRLRPTAAPALPVLIILAAALIAREFLRGRLIASGIAPIPAKDLSYLAVPVVLVMLMGPILRRHANHLRHIFRIEALQLRIILCGVAAGVLLRVAWWSHLVGGIALGLIGDPASTATMEPSFSFDCPSRRVLLLGLAATAVATPLVEETVHRGLLLSGLLHRGRLFAIAVSTLVFMLAHVSSAYLPALLFGLVLALQYCATGAIWFPVATHATYNALIQFDWYCLNGRWNPAPEQVPLTGVGIAAAATLLLAAGLLYLVMQKATSGATNAPRT